MKFRGQKFWKNGDLNLLVGGRRNKKNTQKYSAGYLLGKNHLNLHPRARVQKSNKPRGKRGKRLEVRRGASDQWMRAENPPGVGSGLGPQCISVGGGGRDDEDL